MNGIPQRIWHYGMRIATAFDRHFGALMAAAVAFYALLSLVPVLSVVVSLLGLAIGNPAEALHRIKAEFPNYLPIAGEELLYDTLSTIQRDRGIFGTIGAGGILFSASAIFTNLEIAFNNIWGVPVTRSWLHQRLAALGTMLLTLALLASSLVLTALLAWIQEARIPLVGLRAGEVPFVWQLTGYAVPVVLSIMMFALVYKIVPNRLVPWRSAITGGIVAGLAWEGAKLLFTFYLARFAHYDKVYGSLGSVAIIMVWIYYSATILFVGAEIAADLNRPHDGADIDKHAPKTLTTVGPEHDGDHTA